MFGDFYLATQVGVSYAGWKRAKRDWALRFCFCWCLVQPQENGGSIPRHHHPQRCHHQIGACRRHPCPDESFHHGAAKQHGLCLLPCQATIAFMAYANGNTGDLTVTIKGEAAANAAEPDGKSALELTSRKTTKASVDWTPGHWSRMKKTTASTTPDLKGIVEEIVGASGWACWVTSSLLG